MNGGQINTFHVDRVAPVKIIFADFQGGAIAVRPSGVVDHHIQVAPQPHCFLHHRFDIVRACDVCSKKGGSATSRLNFLDHFVTRSGLNVVDQNLGAMRCEMLGNAFANTATGTRHDNHFLIDVHLKS